MEHRDVEVVEYFVAEAEGPLSLEEISALSEVALHCDLEIDPFGADARCCTFADAEAIRVQWNKILNGDAA